MILAPKVEPNNRFSQIFVYNNFNSICELSHNFTSQKYVFWLMNLPTMLLFLVNDNQINDFLDKIWTFARDCSDVKVLLYFYVT